MQKKLATLIGGSLTLLSSVVLAHPGHDHNHWMSVPIHQLSVAAVVAVAVAVVAGVLYKRRAIKIKDSL